MMSLSFMINSSWPSMVTSVPDHLPNSTRSPTLRSIGISLPDSSRPPGPTAVICPGGLFLGGIWNDDTALGLFFGINAFDHDAIVERTEFHAILLGFCD